MHNQIEKKHTKYSLKKITSNYLLQFGIFGLKIKTFQRLTKNDLITIEWFLKKKIKQVALKNKIKFWNLMVLNTNLTKLSPESRMGKGKGAIFTQALFLRPGVILFEFDNLSYLSYLFYLLKKICIKIYNYKKIWIF